MTDDVVPPRVDELSVLLNMLARLRAGERLDPHEVERALEAGFGALIGLEAALARTQHGTAPGADHRRIGGLQSDIEDLRDALNELRTLSSTEELPRIGYGFVLPVHARPAHPQSARCRPELRPSV
jgi:hypothetical protein